MWIFKGDEPVANPMTEIRNLKEVRMSKSELKSGPDGNNTGFAFWNWGDADVMAESWLLRESAPLVSRIPPPASLMERVSLFGEAIIRFSKKVPRGFNHPENNRLVDQLVGAGASIGANYCEANDAVSGKDFRNRIGTCRKESKETMFFLRMIAASEETLADEARKLWREAKELNLIFGFNLEKEIRVTITALNSKSTDSGKAEFRRRNAGNIRAFSAPRISTLFRIWVTGFRIFAILAICLPDSLPAQAPLSNLLYAVGTTINSGGQEHSFVELDSFDGVSARGKRFAVFGKPGTPTNAATFTLRGTLMPQTDPVTINNLLNQSVALGQNLASLNDGLAFLLHGIPGVTNQTLAQKVATGIQHAATDADLNESLHLLALGNPGMQLCLGRAFTEVIAGITTYELRELNPANGSPGDVIGRVTVVPGAPVILPAPGKPFQVVTNDPVDHLKVRLRWGTPDSLRRLTVLNSGFDVWRIGRDAAEAANFHITPPTTAQLFNNPNFVRANRGAVISSTDYNVGSGPGSAEDPNDRTTYFFADTGRANNTTFTDGEEFYYFITARDLLGRDGLVSPGGLARACRRLPPKPPKDVRVENSVIPGSTNVPRLKVFWRQNTNATDLVTHYWIYRWQNPSGVFTNDATPLTNRIGVVPQLMGTDFNSFIDSTPGALTTPGTSNIWYTVRAVSEAACDPLLSPHAGPAWGVLRQRDGPAPTTGNLIGSCGVPVVEFQKLIINPINTDTQLVHLRFTCLRRDPGITWAQFNITNNVTLETRSIGPLYFPPDGDTLQWDYDAPAPTVSASQTINVGCIVGTAYDHISREAVASVGVPFPATQQREIVFFAGQLLSTALSSSDPLLSVLNNGQSRCIPPYSVVPDASGMVALKFDYSGTPTLLVQAQENGTWSDVAVVSPDSNRVYWVSYPACLVGPVPPFQGCMVNLPDAGDCDEHVAVADPAGAIAPIRVRFRLTPRTAEYRVYRRIDDGPLTLFAQGAAVYDPANPGKIIESKDEAMPPSAARLCYFVQLLDQHGNGSPLSFIGCKDVKPAKPPRPVLAEPQPAGDLNNPQVILNWFCPTAGISRFQFKIARADSPAPGTSSGLTSLKLTPFPLYKKTSAYAGLVSQKIKLISFLEAQLTPLIGPTFGPGPKFNLTATVLPNVPYDICVTPVDEQGIILDGSSSEVWRFTWTPPVVLATVPWPKRPLPPVQDFDTPAPGESLDYFPRVAATAFLTYYNAHEDKYRPVGIRIGEFPHSFGFGGSTVGTTNFIIYNTANSIANSDPNLAVFRSKSPDASRANQILLPIVVYRQQVTNTLFPKVSGDVVQVSPLIERIPWLQSDLIRDFHLVVIPDRLLAMREETYNDHSHYMLYLRDQQPVIAGARYAYYVMRFNAQREVQEIIPAGEIELPLNPFNGN